MTDIPIIFSTAMILALLREVEVPGTGKTMTRRIGWKLKPDPADDKLTILVQSTWQKVKVGDRLWVKENLYRFGGPIEYAADGAPSFPRKMTPSIHCPRKLSRLTLVVTDTKVEHLHDTGDRDAVREGVIDLSASTDPVAQGVNARTGCRYGIWASDAGMIVDHSPKAAFARFWDVLHGAGAWNRNPVVVAIGFRVHKINIDQLQKEAA